MIDQQDGNQFFILRKSFDLLDPNMHNFEILVSNLTATGLKKNFDPKKSDLSGFTENRRINFKIRWFETDNGNLKDVYDND